jgi:hypothetical protein
VRDLGCGLWLAVLVAGHDDRRTGNPGHDRRIVYRGRGQPVVAGSGGHYGLPELFFQAEDAVTGGGELAGLREGPGDVVAGVGGFGG